MEENMKKNITQGQVIKTKVKTQRAQQQELRVS